MGTSTRLLPAAVVAYVAFCVFCLAAPSPSIRALLGLVWILGPPANLIHGTHFLAPFILGTVLVFGIARMLPRVGPGGRALLSVLLVLVWAVFGFLAYAPGA